MKTRRPRVLIVDCHEDVLISFERLLEDAGYDTTTAWSAQEAWQAVQARTFDLLLVNEYLPETNAEDFISELRSAGSMVPCIVMQPSATQITDTGRFLAAGATKVVCKCSQPDVLEAIAAQIGFSGMQAARLESAAPGTQQWR